MLEKDKQEYIRRYEDRYERYGYDPRTLGWTKGRQKLRFHILTSIGDLQDMSVLDLGCGFADLYDFLRERGWRGEYTGFDIVPKLIAVARQRHPDLQLRKMDILSEPVKEKFDYVFASGVFNAEISQDNEGYIFEMLKRMLDISKVGVAADFLSTYVDFRHQGSFHASPERIFSLAKKLARRVSLRHDYLAFEFCLYLFKRDQMTIENGVFDEYAHLL
jgi:SAM-dependent methyltransferase